MLASVGRVVVAREMCIANSFTLEASFCGSNFGTLQDYHFNTGHFQEAGRSLCGALLDYYLPNSTQRNAFFRGNEATESSTPEISYPIVVMENSKPGRRRTSVSSPISSHAEVFQGTGISPDGDSDIDDFGSGSEDSDNGQHGKDVASTSPIQLAKGVGRKRLGLGRRLNVATSTTTGKSNSCNAISHQRKTEACGFASSSQTTIASGAGPRSLATIQASSASTNFIGQRGGRQRQVLVSNTHQVAKLPQKARRVSP